MYQPLLLFIFLPFSYVSDGSYSVLLSVVITDKVTGNPAVVQILIFSFTLAY